MITYWLTLVLRYHGLESTINTLWSPLSHRLGVKTTRSFGICVSLQFYSSRTTLTVPLLDTQLYQVSRGTEFSSPAVQLFLRTTTIIGRPVSWGWCTQSPLWVGSSFMNFSHGSLLMKNIQRGRGVHHRYRHTALLLAAVRCAARIIASPMSTVNSTSIQLNSPVCLHMYVVETEAQNTSN